MGARFGVVIGAAVLGCGRIGFDAPFDAVSDAGFVEPTGPWSMPVAIAELDLAGNQDDPTLTEDQLEIFFDNNSDLWTASRPSADAPWNPPVQLPFNSTDEDSTPKVAPDGLTLYFGSSRTGSIGFEDIFVVTRVARDQPWSAPVRVAELCSNESDEGASPSADGLSIYFDSDRLGGDDLLFMAARPDRGTPWSQPGPLVALDLPGSEQNAFIHRHGLSLWFSAGPVDAQDIFVARRVTTTEPFGPPERVDGISTQMASETDPWVSADGRTIYFTSAVTGSLEIYRATR